MCTGWTCIAERAQELNPHFPTTKPAPPTVVLTSLVSLGCSDPKPWNHPDPFLSHPTSNLAANPLGSTHSPLALLASLLFLEHKYDSTPGPLHLLLPLKHSAPCSWMADSLLSLLSGPCSNATSSGRSTPNLSIGSPCFIALTPS